MADVESYGLAWHPQRGAEIRLKLKGRAWSQPIPVSAADLAAFAAIMREEPVHVANNGWIHTGPEPVGGSDE